MFSNKKSVVFIYDCIFILFYFLNLLAAAGKNSLCSQDIITYKLTELGTDFDSVPKLENEK